MFERTRAALAGALMGKTYDANWFVRFMKLADEEDMASGMATVRDPMKQNAWVALAVNALSRNLARAPFVCYTGDEEDEESDVARLFAKPNSYMSGAQLWQATEGWIKARGECFWILLNGGGTIRKALPKEIRLVHPDLMKHVLNPEETEITLWQLGQGTKGIPLQPEEVVHFRAWNKWDQWRGVNPLISMAEELTQDLNANVSNSRMIGNGSVPRGVLSSKQRLTEMQAKEVQDRWEKAHGGSSRAHRIAVLGADTTYQQIGLSPADLEYFQMRKWNRQTILAMYGVPPAVVGVKDDMSPLSGADTTEQLRSFWNITLIPDQQMIENVVAEGIFRRFDLKNQSGEFDTSEIQELKADERQRSEIDRSEIGAGLKTINEVRKTRGEDPVPWGDVWWAPLAVQPVRDDQEMPKPAPLPSGGPPAAPGEEPEELPEEPEEGPVADALHTAAASLPGSAPHLLIRKTMWPDAWRLNHWEKLARRLAPVETQMKRDLQAWFYAQRSALLARLAREQLSASKSLADDMDDPTFWQQEEGQLKKFALRDFEMAMGLEGEELNTLFHEMGVLPPDVVWSIWDTAAPAHLADRVNRGALSEITGTVRSAIKDAITEGMASGATEKEMADMIRDVYSNARSRTATIARTELGGIINDARFEGFRDIGFEAHSWLSAGDERVREEHNIDGEVAALGERFSNGLLYPNDPDGAPEAIINCRCTTIPEPLRELSIQPEQSDAPDARTLDRSEIVTLAKAMVEAQTAAMVPFLQRLAEMVPAAPKKAGGQ